jgi:GTPase SAR1 family protein
LELFIWDTASQEIYGGLAPIYYRSSAIAIIAYDITVQKSFDSVAKWVNERKNNDISSITIMICGNKIDKNENKIVKSDDEKNLQLIKDVCIVKLVQLMTLILKDHFGYVFQNI